jgi:Fe-S cluster biogenesis protein NfuA
MLPPNEQEYMRYQVSQNIKKLQNQQHKQKAPMSTKIKNELKITKRIKDKLAENNATTIKADKGNSTVIMYRKDYEQKVMNFISCSGASEIDNNITGSFQKALRSTLNNCKHIIDNNKKREIYKFESGHSSTKRVN